MISRSDVAVWAERFGVAPAQIAHDHFISHALHTLGELHPSAHFFGGTALCRTYLEGTRLSEDIDLLHPEPRDFLDDLAARLPSALRREYPGTSCTAREGEGDGVAALLAPPDSTPVKLYAGRLGPNTRAWEFAPTRVQLRYPDLPETQTLQCPTLTTFAAMKLAAWFDRHTPRDLFDLAGLAGARRAPRSGGASDLPGEDGRRSRRVRIPTRPSGDGGCVGDGTRGASGVTARGRRMPPRRAQGARSRVIALGAVSLERSSVAP